jgi:hypothetical protein
MEVLTRSSLARGDTDLRVVGVAAGVVASSPWFLVKFVEQDIGQ